MKCDGTASTKNSVAGGRMTAACAHSSIAGRCDSDAVRQTAARLPPPCVLVRHRHVPTRGPAAVGGSERRILCIATGNFEASVLRRDRLWLICGGPFVIEEFAGIGGPGVDVLSPACLGVVSNPCEHGTCRARWSTVGEDQEHVLVREVEVCVVGRGACPPQKTRPTK